MAAILFRRIETSNHKRVKMNIEGVLGEIHPREYKRRDRIMRNIKRGIVYTQFAGNIYSQEFTEMGDKVALADDRVIRKLIRDEVLIVENSRIKIK